MSNYTFIVANDAAQPQLRKWMEKHRSGIADPESEIRTIDVAPGVALTVISHDLPNSLDVPSSMFFKGHMLDERTNSMVFGLTGWKQYTVKHLIAPDAYGGQFLRARWDQRTVTFTRDAFGMLPLLHTQGDGYVAVSDSMLVLADLRQHMGDPVTPHAEVLLSRALLAVYGGQQLSPDTYVEQISFVPARQTLRVALSATPTAKASGGAMDGLHLNSGETYRDAIRTSAENIARQMATFMELGDWKPALNFSGGYDSRVPLAGAIAAGIAGDMQINTLNTQPAHADDYAVAVVVAERFGLTLNGKSTAGRLSDRTYKASPLMMWALADLGMYDYMTRPRSVRNQIKHINLTGMGGEVTRGNYGWRPWPTIVEAFKDPHPAVAAAVYEQGVKGLKAVGADPTIRRASEVHYGNYRFALHGGTGRPLQMLGFAPLLQNKLVALAHSAKNELPYPTSYVPSIINDVCIALNPELAAMPYDKGKPGRATKDLSPAYIEERLAVLGGAIDTSGLTPYATYGTPDDVPAGPPEFMLNIARARGLDRPMNTPTVLELGAKGVDLLQSEPLRSIYAKIHANAKWRLETKGYSIVGAGKDSPVKGVVLQTLFGSR